MPTTKKKSSKPLRREPQKAEVNGTSNDVMTLAEAAAYLRLAEEDVIRLARDEDLPGRVTGDDWRFLKSALQAWLSQPIKRVDDGIWAFAGAWKDDPQANEMLEEIYRRRGRPMTEG